MCQRNVHAEAGEQTNDALRDGQRLAVAGGVCPGHGNLLALEVLDAAKVVDDMQHVRHALGRMVHVALQVHERRSLLEDTVAVALFQRVHERLLILMTLMDVHVVADADDVSHERDHVCGLTDGFAVGNLGLLLIENLLFQTQEVAGRSKREAGTGGVVAEQGNAETGVEDLRGLVALAQIAQGVGYGKDRVDFVVGLVPGPVEVGLVHVVDAQGFQMSCKLNSFAHNSFSLKNLYILKTENTIYRQA